MIVQRLVQALAVLELIDVLHDGLPGLGLIAELPLLHQFVLPRGVENKGSGIFYSQSYTHRTTSNVDLGSGMTIDLLEPVASLEKH